MSDLKKKDKEKKHTSRGNGPEAQRVAARLDGFDYKNASVLNEIYSRFSSGITHTELRGIAQVICKYTNLSLDRDATRDNRVLIKWFDENWDEIKKVIDNITTIDENGEPINQELLETVYEEKNKGKSKLKGKKLDNSL